MSPASSLLSVGKGSLSRLLLRKKAEEKREEKAATGPALAAPRHPTRPSRVPPQPRFLPHPKKPLGCSLGQPQGGSVCGPLPAQPGEVPSASCSSGPGLPPVPAQGMQHGPGDRAQGSPVRKTGLVSPEYRDGAGWAPSVPCRGGVPSCTER